MNLKDVAQIAIFVAIFGGLFALYQNDEVSKLFTRFSTNTSQQQSLENNDTQQGVNELSTTSLDQVQEQQNMISCKGSPFAGLNGPDTTTEIETDGNKYRVNIDGSTFTVFDDTHIYDWDTKKQTGTRVSLLCVKDLPTEERQKYYATSGEFVSVIKSMNKYSCDNVNTIDLSIPLNINFTELFDKECKRITTNTDTVQTTTTTNVTSTQTNTTPSSATSPNIKKTVGNGDHLKIEQTVGKTDKLTTSLGFIFMFKLTALNDDIYIPIVQSGISLYINGTKSQVTNMPIEDENGSGGVLKNGVKTFKIPKGETMRFTLEFRKFPSVNGAYKASFDTLNYYIGTSPSLNSWVFNSYVSNSVVWDGAITEATNAQSLITISTPNSGTTWELNDPSGQTSERIMFDIKNMPKYPSIFITLIDTDSNITIPLGKGVIESATTLKEGSNTVSIKLNNSGTNGVTFDGRQDYKIAVSLFDISYDIIGGGSTSCIPGKYPDFVGTCLSGQATAKFIKTALSDKFKISSPD